MLLSRLSKSERAGSRAIERRRLLKPGHRLRAEIWLVRFDGKPAVLKDFGCCPLLVRWTLGWWLTRREYLAYRRLEGIPGIPRLYERVGPYRLLLEYVESSSAGVSASPPSAGCFFERLTMLVERVHARGVAHGDLKRVSNILVTPQLEPYLIDFAAAFWRGGRWNVGRNWVFGQLCRVDHRGILKMKQRLAPECLTSEERHRLSHPTLLERLERRARRLIGRGSSPRRDPSWEQLPGTGG